MKRGKSYRVSVYLEVQVHGTEGPADAMDTAEEFISDALDGETDFGICYATKVKRIYPRKKK